MLSKIESPEEAYPPLWFAPASAQLEGRVVVRPYSELPPADDAVSFVRGSPHPFSALSDNTLEAIRFRLSYKRALGEALTPRETADLERATEELQRRAPDEDEQHWSRIDATNDALEMLLRGGR